METWDIVQSTALLLDKHNTFYAWFNPVPATRSCGGCHIGAIGCGRKTVLQSGQPTKSPWAGWQPGLRVCAYQLAELFTNMFNPSLDQSVVPSPFKAYIIVLVPKKPVVTCLNDYCPVALTSVSMKCFERLIKSTFSPPFLTP